MPVRGSPRPATTGYDRIVATAVIYPSRSRSLGIAGLASVMVAVSLFAARHAGALVAAVGWFGVAFFGLGVVVGLARAIRPRPIFVLDEEGLRATAGVIRRSII